MNNRINSTSSSQGSRLSKHAIALLTAALFTSFTAFWQNGKNASFSVPTKDLEKQYKKVIVELKKEDPDIDAAAEAYHVKNKDVVESIDADVKYVIETLIPTIYMNHNIIKQQLWSWLNKKNVLQWIYLNKLPEIQKFSAELASRVWNFEKNNPYSNKAKFPVYVINDFADYTHEDIEKQQLTIVESVFVEAVADFDAFFQKGTVKLKYPLAAMFNKDLQYMRTFVLGDSKHPLEHYIVGQPVVDDKGAVIVEINLNKFMEEEVQAWKYLDKFQFIQYISTKIFEIASIKAYKAQYDLYIDEWSNDIRDTK